MTYLAKNAYNFRMDKATMLKAVNEHHAYAWAKFVRLYPKLKGFRTPTVSINNRLSATAGRCFTEDSRYELSGKFLAKFPREILTVILPHELAHQVDYNLNGWYARKKHHGPEWCAIMGAYGLPPEPYHRMEL